MQNSAFRTALRLQGERRIGLTCFNLTEDIIIEQYVAFAEEYHLSGFPCRRMYSLSREKL